MKKKFFEVLDIPVPKIPDESGGVEAFDPAHKSGLFAHNRVPGDVQKIIDLLEREAADWVMVGNLIAVRCHDDETNYSITVAEVVHQTGNLKADD